MELDVPVRFAETDLMGVVHHGIYAVWLEAGRIAWLDAAGVPYTEISRGGNHFAVTELNIRYRAPARFGDVVRIVTRLQALRSRQVSFAYEVYNAADRELLANAVSEHICVDLTGRMAKIPADVAARIRTGADQIMRNR